MMMGAKNANVGHKTNFCSSIMFQWTFDFSYHIAQLLTMHGILPIA